MTIYQRLNSMAAIGVAIAIGACSAPGPRHVEGPVAREAPGAQPLSGARFGVVDRIEVIRKGDGSNIAGTVIGLIVGGLIGHQIGSGSGNTAATIAGAAGGAVAGHEIERRSRGPNEAFRVSVRMDNGSFRVVVQEHITDLRPGDRVRIQGGFIYPA
jgi:outer membrane lipoprotein SlyB